MGSFTKDADKRPAPERKPLPLSQREQPPYHIEWRQVIELNPNMPDSDRQTMAAELTKWENSKIGQADFYVALKAQAKLPKTPPVDLKKAAEKDWEEYFQAYNKKNPDSQFNFIEDFKEFIGTTRVDLYAQQKEYPKIFISTLDAVKDKGGFLNEVIEGAGGDAFGNIVQKQSGITLHLPTAMGAKFPKQTSHGVKLLHEPFVALLGHELNHAVINQEGFVSIMPMLARACKEEHAMAAANQFLHEKLPNKLLRIVYSPVEIKLTSGETKRQFEQEVQKGTVSNPKEKKKEVEFVVANDIQLNAGCTPLSDNEAMAKAKSMLHKAGITDAFVAQLEALKPKSLGAGSELPLAHVPQTVKAPAPPPQAQPRTVTSEELEAADKKRQAALPASTTTHHAPPTFTPPGAPTTSKQSPTGQSTASPAQKPPSTTGHGGR